MTLEWRVVVTDESGSDSESAESTSSSYSSLSDFVIDIQNSDINGETPGGASIVRGEINVLKLLRIFHIRHTIYLFYFLIYVPYLLYIYIYIYIYNLRTMEKWLKK